MLKACNQCGKNFEITNEDRAFYKNFSINFTEAVFSLPEPDICPSCRSQKRCIHRNEMSLFKRKCDLCKKDIVSMYPDGVSFPVYCQKCFFGNQWNAFDFGSDYDFNRPFFDQFKDLLSLVPHLAIINKMCQNSEYCNYSYANKNCYLTQGSHYEEDCYYDIYSAYNKNCVDNLSVFKSELLYDCYFCKNCYRCWRLINSDNCNECFFSRDLKSCKHCLFCANLHQKEYFIFNKAVNRHEYENTLKSLRLDTYSGFETAKIIMAQELLKFPVRALHQINCQNCHGSPMNNCKNIRQSFFCTESEDSAYSFELNAVFNSMDTDNMGYDKSEHCYQLIGCLGLFDCMFCNACWNGSSVRYSHFCYSCNDCFGCASLQQQKNCILNKHYSKEEYEKFILKIIKHMQKTGEWGQYFPSLLSPFAYNESKAHEIYPLSKKEALQKGYKWKEDQPLTDADKVIEAKDLPETIEEIPDEITKWVVRCSETKKEFRIIKEELAFYKRLHLPPPRLHYMERFRQRCAFRNPHKLWKRKCDKCGNEMVTTYAPERPEIVYCEQCYFNTVY